MKWIYRIGKAASLVVGALVGSGTLGPVWAGVAAAVAAAASLFNETSVGAGASGK